MVERVERVAELADATVDVEHMKAVVRSSAGRRLAEHEVARSALELFAEALHQRLV